MSGTADVSSCLKLSASTTIPSYSKEFQSEDHAMFCTINDGIFTFYCESSDANSDYLSWNLNNITWTFSSEDYGTPNASVYMPVPDEYDDHHADLSFVLHSANTYRMQSSLTVFPTMANYSLYFYVECSAQCGQKQAIYQQAGDFICPIFKCM